jgi:hypothetical protein
LILRALVARLQPRPFENRFGIKIGSNRAGYPGYEAIPFMADSAEQLQRLYLAGFELQTFERYPKCVGVIRDSCIALLVPGVDGLQVLGAPGWRMGEVMGVLTEKDGQRVFQAKSEIVEATGDRLAILGKFRDDLAAILKGK